MKNVIRKILCYTTALSLAFSGYVMPTVNANADSTTNSVLLGDWEHYFESWDPSGLDSDIMNSTATNTDSGFTANISTTGWQRLWRESYNVPEDAIILEDGYGDNPNQLRSETTASVNAGSIYTYQFTVTNDMYMEEGYATEKNITITIGNGYDTTLLYETVTVPAGSTKTYSFEFVVPSTYESSVVEIQLSYGCYAYSYALKNAYSNGTVTAEEAQKMVDAGYALAYPCYERTNSFGKLTFMGSTLTEKKTNVFNPRYGFAYVKPNTVYTLTFTNYCYESDSASYTLTVDSGVDNDSEYILFQDTVYFNTSYAGVCSINFVVPSDYPYNTVRIHTDSDDSFTFKDTILTEGHFDINQYNPVEVMATQSSTSDWYTIKFSQSELALITGMHYRIYVDGELYLEEMYWPDGESCSGGYLEVGKHTVKVVPILNGIEGTGTTTILNIKKIYSELDVSYNPTAILASNPKQNAIQLAWVESTEAKNNSATYNIYLDGELMLSEIACATQYLNNVKSGTHTVTVKTVVGDGESSGISYNVTVKSKPIDVTDAIVACSTDNTISILWQETDTQIVNEQTYNVYVNDELMLSNVAAGLHTINNISGGDSVVKITAIKDGVESSGVNYNVTVTGKYISSVELEINGFQISAVAEGFRTIYTIGDKKNEVVKAGLVYGLADYATADDMIVGSTNEYVYNYDATSEGLRDKSYSDLEAATSYTMTMKFGTYDVDFLTSDIMVRAYAQLQDGTYVYSDIATCSVYDVADLLYQGLHMNNATNHEYLYNKILTKVTPDYEQVDYTWDSAIIKPYK